MIIARRAAENNLLPNASNDTNDEDSQKKSDQTGLEENTAKVLTKSKSRRLRKKQKSGLLKTCDQTSDSISDSDNSRRLLGGDCQGNVLESVDKYDQNFCDLRLNVVESFDNVLSVLSAKAEQIFSQNLENGSEDKNLTVKELITTQRDSSLHLTAVDQISETYENKRDLITFENSLGSDVNNKFSFPIRNHSELNTHFCHQIDTDSNCAAKPKEGICNTDSSYNSELFALTVERKNNEGSLNDDQLFKIGKFSDQKSCCKLTSDLKVNDTEPVSSERNNKSIKVLTETSNKDTNTSKLNLSEDHIKYKNKKKNGKKSKSRSCEREDNKVESDNRTLPSTDSKLENKLGNAKLSSVFINSNEDVALSSERISDTISNVVKFSPVNQELIENQKNIEITASSKPLSETLRISPVKIESDHIVIDLTKDSSLDFTTNNDLNLCKVEEQRIIIDSVPCSTTDAVPTTDRIVSENKSKNNVNKVEVTGWKENILKPDITVNTHSEGIDSSDTFKLPKVKMNSQEKTREQIKSEREAKKAAKKAASKAKAQGIKSEVKKVEEKLKDTPSTNVINSEKIKRDMPLNKAKEDSVPVANQTLVCEIRRISITKAEINLPEVKVEEKSKAELRAERRAKQEAQRAAKEGLLAQKNKATTIEPAKTESLSKPVNVVKKLVKKTIVNEDPHQVNLFKHLYHERELSVINAPILNTNIHPAIVRLGVQYASKVIVGSNARCIALLAAVKQLIQDFERPSQADFTRGLEASLRECGAYLHHCRPMAVSMQNALRHLKWQMTQLPTTVSDDNAKSALENSIDTYILEQIQLAGKAISITIQTKISNGDIILTYGYSSLINKILCDAHTAGRQFRVVVVDGRPWLEGKEQLRRLARHGVECSYILINALSFIMPEVSKVFLGAHAILANGAVMSRAGTAQIALMAKAFNVPVLVACETHKSCERVQTDSIVYNEIGDPDELVQNLAGSVKKPILTNWRARKSLNLLNITYDVTPANLVSAVVTELAILPCTSVPVILRIKPSEI